MASPTGETQAAAHHDAMPLLNPSSPLIDGTSSPTADGDGGVRPAEKRSMQRKHELTPSRRISLPSVALTHGTPTSLPPSLVPVSGGGAPLRMSSEKSR